MVNVNPTNTRPHSDTPEIRKYKKRFNSEILCAALWGESRTVGREEGGLLGQDAHFLLPPRAGSTGVNLLVGTENGLMLLDRSGQGKVYSLINRRRFQQMDVLEGLNLLTTISGQGPPGARGGTPRGPSLPLGPSLPPFLPRSDPVPLPCLSRKEEQAARLLPLLAAQQDFAQRPRSGEEAGLDHRGGHGGLHSLPCG